MKVFGHLSSLYMLRMGTRIKITDQSGINYVDVGSISVLARAAFETYLTFHFIFIDPASAEESRFRFDCWDLAGYLERLKHPTMSQEAKEKQSQELAQAEKTKAEIQVSPFYGNLSDKQRKALLKGEWKLHRSWHELAIRAGFGEAYFKSTYAYLCGHAHSGRVSVMQIQQALTREQQEAVSKVWFDVGKVIMAKFIVDYVLLCRATHEISTAYPEMMKVAMEWIAIARSASSVFQNAANDNPG